MATNLSFHSPSKPSSHFQLKPKLSPPLFAKISSFRCRASVQTLVAVEPEPVFTSVKTFAPATVANLGPGFDFLGCAVDGLGDHVTLRVDPSVRAGEILISEITGTATKLSTNPLRNCAGIAAIATMKMLGIRSVGLSLDLHKGLPLGSGLGSSAASAAAAAVAAALEAGAFGCTISGAGPTAVAVIDVEEKGEEIGEKMVEAFTKVGNLKSVASVKKLDKIGARLVSSISR
ncbi:hypothetical protein HID58_054634 [Brassica napus]|uniref:GHMP kinase N-terminal domain-containing protein n=1 Tax=Brassica napus TaxID=3708 RepID=A0ABQ8AI62_BRANA|nr:hypothetical protein HID58_054634 [Brassica napus]